MRTKRDPKGETNRLALKMLKHLTRQRFWAKKNRTLSGAETLRFFRIGGLGGYFFEQNNHFVRVGSPANADTDILASVE